uniref:Uncharacterized protein n=1 Tax=Anguilla anguilla TaxID=7936 RepID=A0A0E9XD86_ANGAN
MWSRKFLICCFLFRVPAFAVICGDSLTTSQGNGQLSTLTQWLWS